MKNKHASLLGALVLTAVFSGYGPTWGIHETAQGTMLSVTAQAGAPVCADQVVAVVTVAGVLISTATTDTAVVTLSIDEGPEIEIGSIRPEDFVSDGRQKEATFSYNLTVPNGTHTIAL